MNNYSVVDVKGRSILPILYYPQQVSW